MAWVAVAATSEQRVLMALAAVFCLLAARVPVPAELAAKQALALLLEGVAEAWAVSHISFLPEPGLTYFEWHILLLLLISR